MPRYALILVYDEDELQEVQSIFMAEDDDEAKVTAQLTYESTVHTHGWPKSVRLIERPRDINWQPKEAGEA